MTIGVPAGGGLWASDDPQASPSSVSWMVWLPDPQWYGSHT